MNISSTHAQLISVTFVKVEWGVVGSEVVLDVRLFDGTSEIVRLKQGDSFTMQANTAFYDPELERPA